MLRIGGLAPLSTADWPGMLSAVVFCQGCPWRCGYCHNPHLIAPRGDTETPWAAVRAFLERRQGLLDAVVFSGGEPTLQDGLLSAVREVRTMGFKVGLHTAGMYPQRLAAVLPWIDWVGIDVKAPFDDYARTTGVPASGARARASLEAVLAAGVAYEVRTTVHPRLLDDAALVALADALAAMGVRHYVVQAFRSAGCGDSALAGSAPRVRPLGEVMAPVAARFADFSVRA